MKLYRYTAVRALCTLLIGALVILFPTNATRYMILTIGVLFLVPGVISLLAYLRYRNKQADKSAEATDEGAGKTTKVRGEKLFPIIGVGSILFGFILIVFPSAFRSALLYILGAYLIIASLAQAFNLYKYSRIYKVNFIPFLISALTGIAGIVIIMLNYKTSSIAAADTTKPLDTYTPSLIFGIAGVIYGVSELMYSIYFRKPEPKTDKKVLAHHNADSNGEYVEAEVVE